MQRLKSAIDLVVHIVTYSLLSLVLLSPPQLVFAFDQDSVFWEFTEAEEVLQDSSVLQGITTESSTNIGKLSARSIAEFDGSISQIQVNNVGSAEIAGTVDWLNVSANATFRSRTQPQAYAVLDRFTLRSSTRNTTLLIGNFTQHIGAGILTSSPYAQSPNIGARMSLRTSNFLRSGGSKVYSTGNSGIGFETSLDLNESTLAIASWFSLDATNSNNHSIGGVAAYDNGTWVGGLHIHTLDRANVAGSLFGFVTHGETTIKGEVALNGNCTSGIINVYYKPISHKIAGWITAGVNGFQSDEQLARASVFSTNIHSALFAGVESRTRQEHYTLRIGMEHEKPLRSHRSWPSTHYMLLAGYSWNNTRESTLQRGLGRLMIHGNSEPLERRTHTTIHAMSRNVYNINGIEASSMFQLKLSVPDIQLSSGVQFSLRFSSGMELGAIALQAGNVELPLYAAVYILPGYTQLQQTRTSLFSIFLKQQLRIQTVNLNVVVISIVQEHSAPEIRIGASTQYLWQW